MGLALARALRETRPAARIAILEKENGLARHASGRTSGVLHAGFYYSADSLKARFSVEGNASLSRYCRDNGLPFNPCQKVVVARNATELEVLYELEKRGRANGVEVALIDEDHLEAIDPNAKTFQQALLSPTTSTVDPVAIVTCLVAELTRQGVDLFLNTPYGDKLDDNTVRSPTGQVFSAGKIINAAGLYADRIARDFGFSQRYTVIPFKGIFLRYGYGDRPVRTNIYPVPNLNNPFLGVHFTVAVDGGIMIGPTAIPALWRENYHGLDRFRLDELLQILGYEARLWWADAFNFRRLAWEEIKKYSKRHLVREAAGLVKKIDLDGFNQWVPPGIRAQLVDTKALRLVDDFIVEGDASSVHLLNAVSPAFTCSFPFARWVVDDYLV